ncbi:MAG: hypothetical protein MJZ81_07930 [Bacteroidales bacterium]|nr:hypothetical protein [Bacteroidales bacterium]
MAKSYLEEQNQVQNQQPVSTATGTAAQPQATATQAANTAKAQTSAQTGSVISQPVQTNANPYKGLTGLSSGTKQRLGTLQQGYQQSDAVQNAYNYLQSVQNNQPGAYNSRFSQQLDDIYQQIMGRKDFSYDLNADMLYKQYRDMYQQQGRQAMVDTMGNAAALTGGYGNSYAASAGNQAYQQYLGQMNAMLPEFYDRAYQRDRDQLGDLYNRYNLGMTADEVDYGRYQDNLAQWNTDRDFGLRNYGTLYDQDYGNYRDDLNYYNTLAAQENSNYRAQQQYSYQTAMQLLQNGVMPTDALLKEAGLSKADAEALKAGPVIQYVQAPTGNGTKTTAKVSGAAGQVITNPADAYMYANLNGSTGGSFMTILEKLRNIVK